MAKSGRDGSCTPLPFLERPLIRSRRASIPFQLEFLFLEILAVRQTDTISRSLRRPQCMLQLARLIPSKSQRQLTGNLIGRFLDRIAFPIEMILISVSDFMEPLS